MVGKSAKIMVLPTHINILKGDVWLTVSSTLPVQQAIAHSIRCSKAEKEIVLLQDGGKILKKEHRSPRSEIYTKHLPPSRPAEVTCW
jgi:hypothetical protein